MRRTGYRDRTDACGDRGAGVAGFSWYEYPLFSGSGHAYALLRVENTLYQGCRSATKDQHYATDFTALAASGALVYRTACSRDGPPGVKRVYVQDLIREDAERVWELGRRGAWVYISGCVFIFSVV